MYADKCLDKDSLSHQGVNSLGHWVSVTWYWDTEFQPLGRWVSATGYWVSATRYWDTESQPLGTGTLGRSHLVFLSHKQGNDQVKKGVDMNTHSYYNYRCSWTSSSLGEQTRYSEEVTLCVMGAGDRRHGHIIRTRHRVLIHPLVKGNQTEDIKCQTSLHCCS